jgi:hypothetical protein
LLLIVDFVVGPITAGIIAGSMALVFGYLWYVLPVKWRNRTEKKKN